eukprot:jgi/Botrbrau1/5376/Bobra.0346s0039.2
MFRPDSTKLTKALVTEEIKVGSGTDACSGMSVALEPAGAPTHATGNLEQQYWAWANDRKAGLMTFLSMVGSMLLASSCLNRTTRWEGWPTTSTCAMKVMLAVSAVAAVTIVTKKQTFLLLPRHTVMTYHVGVLVPGGFKHIPLLDRGLARQDQLQAFLRICCHRWIGLALGSLAWRVRISRVPAVSFSGMLISALGAVRASNSYAERDPGNWYVQFLCAQLNNTLLAARMAVVKVVTIFSVGQLPARELTEALCEATRITPRHTVLLIWLLQHAVVFWIGFRYHLRDEVLDRKAFLSAHPRWQGSELRLAPLKPMVLLMIAIHVYVFSLLLLFGDTFA